MELKEHQPPITIEQQIDNLKALGLIIGDEDYARAFLNDVSYFRLVKAYSLNLKLKNSSYMEGITFEHIVELYLFNSNFRQLLFPQIEKIEINLRCRISNYFSNKYGLLGYEKPGNFQNADFHRESIDEIKEEIRRNKNAPFVRNFQKNYVDGKLPFYALIELFNFGTLSKFYKNMKNDDKKNIAVHLESVILTLRVGLKALHMFAIFVLIMDVYTMQYCLKCQLYINNTHKRILEMIDYLAYCFVLNIFCQMIYTGMNM